jgi:hypothetical protein
MLPGWLRHMFRDRIGPASAAPLRGLYLIDLADDLDPDVQEAINARWHAAWTARPPDGDAS